MALRRAEMRSGALEAGRASVDLRLTYDALRADLEARWEAGIDGALAPSTLAGYRSDLNVLLAVWGTRPVATTTEADVVAYIQQLRRQGHARQTIANRLGRLAQLMDAAVRRGALRRRPCAIPQPRARRGEGRRAGTSDALYAQLVALAAADPDPRRLAVLLLAGDAGLRRGDLTLLAAEHLELAGDDRTHGWIRVPVLIDDGGRVRGPKRLRARAVPILTRRLAAALAALPAHPGRALLWPVTSGAGVDKLMQPLWRAAGCAGQLHALRHRYSAWAQGALGVPPAIVQQWLGHQRLSTTALYTVAEAAPPPGTLARATPDPPVS